MRQRNDIELEVSLPSNVEGGQPRVRQQIHVVSQANDALDQRALDLLRRTDAVGGGTAQWVQVCGVTRWLQQRMVKLRTRLAADLSQLQPTQPQTLRAKVCGSSRNS